MSQILHEPAPNESDEAKALNAGFRDYVEAVQKLVAAWDGGHGVVIDHLGAAARWRAGGMKRLHAALLPALTQTAASAREITALVYGVSGNWDQFDELVAAFAAKREPAKVAKPAKLKAPAKRKAKRKAAK